MDAEKIKNSHILFNQEILPKIQEIEHKYKQSFISKDLIDEYNDFLRISNNKSYYKRSNNKSHFWAYLWKWLTIFPLCGLFHKRASKKYNQLKQKQKELNDRIHQEKNAKLLIHKQIVDYMTRKNEDNSYYKYINEIMNLINIKPMGYIRNKLIENLRCQSLFWFDNKNTNSYKTTWSVFNDNKIVIHQKTQTLKMIPWKYEGCRRIILDGKEDRLYAYHYELYPEFIYELNDYFFMQSCSNLEFKLDKMYLSNSFNDKKPKENKLTTKVRLENNDFEEMFDFSRNNEVEFRMIWTPLAQERLVNDVSILNYYGESVDQYYFSKSGPFLMNSYNNDFSYQEFSKKTKDIFNAFLDNAEQTYEDLISNIHNNILKYINCQFNALLPGFLIPIISSENHKNIIQECKRDYQENYYLLFYCLLEMFNEKIFKLDTDTFYSINYLNVDEDNILLANINAKSFKRVPQRIKKDVYSKIHKNFYPVTIKYDKYIPTNINKNLYIGFINNSTYYYDIRSIYSSIFSERANKSKYIVEKLSKQLNTLKEFGLKLSIRDSIVALFDSNGLGYKKAKPILLEIIYVLNNS